MKNKNSKHLSKTEELKVEVKYSKNNIKIDECLLNVLKQKYTL